MVSGVGFVYILRCKINVDSREMFIYIGSTVDLRRRLSEHKSGQSRYTKRFSYVELAGYIVLPRSNIRYIEYSLKRHRRWAYAMSAKLKGETRENYLKRLVEFLDRLPIKYRLKVLFDKRLVDVKEVIPDE